MALRWVSYNFGKKKVSFKSKKVPIINDMFGSLFKKMLVSARSFMSEDLINVFPEIFTIVRKTSQHFGDSARLKGVEALEAGDVSGATGLFDAAILYYRVALLFSKD